MDDFKQLFEERRSILDAKATQYREERDSWNEKTKELVCPMTLLYAISQSILSDELYEFTPLLTMSAS